MAGTTVVNQIQLGDNADATRNFVLRTNQDGTLTLARGNVGATSQDILQISSGDETVQRIKSFPSTNATGTVVTLPAIPSWAKEITVGFIGVSTTGTSLLQLQLGTSAGFDTANYFLASMRTNANALNANSITTGFGFPGAASLAAYTFYGSIILTSMGDNHWSVQGGGYVAADAYWSLGGGKTLSDVLTQIRLTTVNGTDTFDLGSIGLLVKG